ncbi:HTH domain-containing protein [Pseudomonas sp. MS19]|uniref:HTH domain-containing protein n=1 Tax=Pseudomonas sp. MS19 TaxID=2579939 RepID=UPI0015626E5D|nr:HTH domain-containing protein [Pseudomonas sp. MS19]NRH26727.1 HTH domain-containing protein [Pseudomonas sp. MS19]
MDSLITAAAQALAAGDALGALNRVALRDDAPALALRGIAMAQLGDLARAKILLRKACQTFSPRETMARARCAVAEAEVALADRDLSWPTQALLNARATLEAHADFENAAHTYYLQARRWLLLGRLDEAQQALAKLDGRRLSAALKAACELVVAGIAMRRLQAQPARDALERALHSARQSAIAALVSEVENTLRVINQPVARLMKGGQAQPLLLDEVEALHASSALVVDACCYAISDSRTRVSLATRPVLFALAYALAEAWPADIARAALYERAFRGTFSDETHRARLRVEIGRLRGLLGEMAAIKATANGFVLQPRAAEIAVLARPVTDKNGAILALLSDAQAWSSSALAMALGISQRSVQRALDALETSGLIKPIGNGRARRWITSPVPRFATTLLLPVSLATD